MMCWKIVVTLHGAVIATDLNEGNNQTRTDVKKGFEWKVQEVSVFRFLAKKLSRNLYFNILCFFVVLSWSLC